MDSNTNSKMILHCGGQAASLDELRDVPLPEATDTYSPVSHFDLVTTTGRMAADLLGHTYQLRKDLYALAKGGDRMFFLLQY
jgi:hypothetical protein